MRSSKGLRLKPDPLSLASLRRGFVRLTTNTVVGADIRCAETGAVVIKIDGAVYRRLPHVPGSPYQITLENYESRSQVLPPDRVGGNYLAGDFILVYDFLDVAGLTYNMFCPKSVLHSDDCDCEIGFVSRFD